MAMVTVEIACADGHVLLTISDDEAIVQIVITADECRELSNSLGEAIQCVSRARMMT
jgi:hypothetical protein